MKGRVLGRTIHGIPIIPSWDPVRAKRANLGKLRFLAVPARYPLVNMPINTRELIDNDTREMIFDIVEGGGNTTLNKDGILIETAKQDILMSSRTNGIKDDLTREIAKGPMIGIGNHGISMISVARGIEDSTTANSPKIGIVNHGIPMISGAREIENLPYIPVVRNGMTGMTASNPVGQERAIMTIDRNPIGHK